MPATALPLSRAHTRVSRPPEPTTGHTGWHRALVPAVERERLAADLGALLRSERLAAGWSLGGLARAVPCHRSTLAHLQAGTRRPSGGLLAAIASVLAVDDPQPLRARLIAAAGESLRPDSDGVLRHRIRAAQLAIVTGRRPLPSDLAHRIDLHRRAGAAWRESLSILDRCDLDDLDDLDALDRAAQLHDLAWRLTAQAGPSITLRLGRHELRYGIGFGG